MLYGECKRKGLRHPPELAAWVDLKLVYKDFYGRKPSGINGALKDAGIVFDGWEHSGIDDAVNTAKLAVKMSKDGCDIRQTKGLHGILTKKWTPLIMFYVCWLNDLHVYTAENWVLW